MARVLMFSAGLDSFVIKRLLQFENDECLFVRMGTRENQIEEKVIDDWFPGVIKTDLPIDRFELSNKIIPFRNHFLAMVAANFANEIYFGFTAGDTTKDKDYVFKSQIEGMLNYFSLDKDKVCVQGPFSIEMPFKQMTKTQLVADYLGAGYDPESLIHVSSSCYAGYDKPCGECRSCMRKFVALEMNNVASRYAFKSDPVDSLSSFYEECQKKNRKQETLEVQKCLQKYGATI